MHGVAREFAPSTNGHGGTIRAERAPGLAQGGDGRSRLSSRPGARALHGSEGTGADHPDSGDLATREGRSQGGGAGRAAPRRDIGGQPNSRDGILIVCRKPPFVRELSSVVKIKEMQPQKPAFTFGGHLTDALGKTGSEFAISHRSRNPETASCRHRRIRWRR